MMDQHQVNIARHHAYLLLSRLFLGGLTADLQPFVEEIAQLTAVCPHPFNNDQAAADHQHIFSYDIYPYESIFRDPSGLLGGELSNQLAGIYSQAGFKSVTEPGHIGNQLAYLAFLSEQKAAAVLDNDEAALAHYTNIQADFLRNHLLSWLPPLEISLSFSGNSFYAAMGAITLDLVSDQAQTIELTFGSSISAKHSSPPPEIWHDPQTDLKKIAHYLATPPHSGIYLGREAISELARSVELPRGFGGRRQMLSNLLRSASQYGQIPALFSVLADYAFKWEESYQAQIDIHPHLAGWIQPWRKRARETAVSLSQMQELVLTIEES